jgi:phosphohistidine phosphatase
MLRLLLLRHSKAVPFTGSGDHDRALTERGRADAARLGAFIADQKIAPQAAVHSGARRTQETLAIVLRQVKAAVAVSLEPRLYEATGAAFTAVVRGAADTTAARLIVGHNPSIADAACRLAGAGDRRLLLKMASKFPTSALAVIDFDAPRWDDVDDGAGRLVHFTTPARLGGADE